MEQTQQKNLSPLVQEMRALFWRRRPALRRYTRDRSVSCQVYTPAGARPREAAFRSNGYVCRCAVRLA